MTDLSDLQQRYPDWLIRPTPQEALFIATRRGRRHLDADEISVGLAMTLIEETPEALAESLDAQARIEFPKC
jgi:hypothetical protein